MKILASLALLFVTSIAFSQEYSKVKIIATDAEMAEIAALGLPVDHGTHKRNTFFITDLSEYDIQTLADNGYQYEILIQDVKAYYAKRSAESLNNLEGKNSNCADDANDLPTVPNNFHMNSNYGGFYKYQDMLDDLDLMRSMYPNLITAKEVVPNETFDQDSTFHGNYVYYVKITSGFNGADDPTKPNVLYTSIHHAREPMSMSQTMFYMWYLLENYSLNEEVTYLVDHTEMFFIPCLNPDGYLINEADDPNGFGMHRKNGRPIGTNNPGVDLNRNYSYGWNTTGVSSDVNNDTYPGTHAFSEPETQSMHYMATTFGFVSAFNAHSYGNLLLYPIGTTSNEFADHHDYFAELSDHMVEHNGYLAQKSSGLYPASGDSDDYLYKDSIGVGVKDTVYAWTPEVGTDFWPAAGDVVSTCQGMVHPNLTVAHMAHRYVTVSNDDPTMISSTSGNFTHTATRFGLESGLVTVSAEPLLNVAATGAPIDYNLDLRESVTNTISYNLVPGLQFGDEIKYILVTDHVAWTHRDTITRIYGDITLQSSDDGSNTDNWTGDWSTTTATYVSPSSSFTDSPGGNYSNNDDKTYTYNETIDLTSAESAQISFYAKWSIEADWDYCQFQVSTDNGATWQGQCGNYTNLGVEQLGWGGQNQGIQPVDEPIYDGTQSDWVYEEINLSDYLGQSINVRFVFQSDGGVSDDGFYFDDFSISYNESTSGLADLDNAIKVFPNPANNELVVSSEDILNNEEVMVHNAAGQIVYKTQIHQLSKKLTINTSGWEEGVYFLTLKGHYGQLVPVKFTIIHHK